MRLLSPMRPTTFLARLRPVPRRARRLRGLPAASLLLLLLLSLGGRPLAAHELGAIQVEATFHRDATWTIEIAIDEEHVPTNLPPPPGGSASVPAIAGLTPELERRLGPFLRALTYRPALRFDGQPARASRFSVAEPPPSDDPFAPAPRPTFTLSGEIPAGAREVTWSVRLSVGRYPLALSNEGDAAPARQWLQGPEESTPFPLAAHVVPPSRLAIVRQYLGLGFTHILPLGLDHILFVLGLFLLSERLKPLLLQVSAFTVAHTLTLALSIYGVISLPSRVVEPLIALSIVYVAVENVVAPALRPWRVALVFGFGLLHGLGFAGVLSELGLPRAQFLPAVLSFNVGVELGQLAVIGLAFLALGLPWRHAAWYRQRIVVPASLAIAGVGLYWSIERVFL
jgi:HupE / UreJ protein